jgi:transposase InsO family protein
MANILLLLFHFASSLVKLAKPGGTKALVAENLLLRQQLIVARRGLHRSPRLLTSERFTFALLTPAIGIRRLKKTAIILKPATLLRLHKELVMRKYRKIFSSRAKPGPKGPSQELIDLVDKIKRHNPRKGYDQIAMQLQEAFGVHIDKHVVRRILEKHFLSTHPSGISWLTFLAQQKESLWSIDFFRCESINLRSYWVMVVMDVFSRRIIGFAVHPDALQHTCTKIRWRIYSAKKYRKLFVGITLQWLVPGACRSRNMNSHGTSQNHSCH